MQDTTSTIQETYEIGGKTLTRQQLVEQFNMPLDADIVGKNAVSLDSEEFVKRAKAKYFFSCFPIDGFAGSTYSKIYDEILKGYHPANLFNPELINIVTLQTAGLGPKQAANFVQGLNKFTNTEIDYNVLIDTMNITGCGLSIRKQFANKLSNLPYDFSGLTKDIISYLESDECKQQMEQTKTLLTKYIGITFVPVKPEIVKEITATTKKFVLTGSPKEFGYKTKGEFLQHIPNWIEISKVPDADYLITSDLESSSSKTKAAKANNTEIITYEQAIQIYNS